MYSYGNLTLSDAYDKCKDFVNNAKIPNIEEAMSLFYNKRLIGDIEYLLWSNAKDEYYLNSYRKASTETGRVVTRSPSTSKQGNIYYTKR